MADAVGTDNITALAYAPNVDCPKAGEIITAVRDLMPDPVYDPLTDAPLPDANGSFLRASTLYRWLSGGIREVARRANWIVIDWTAVPQAPGESIFYLPHAFAHIDSAFCNQYRLVYLDEVHTIYPSTSIAQPLWYSVHSRSDHVELSLWPFPDRLDPAPALMSPMDAVSSTMDLASTAGFLSNGYVRCEGELMHYSHLAQDVSPLLTPGLRGLRRGVGGTSAVIHMQGVAVQHLSIWVRGWRAPMPVTRAADCVEVPVAYQPCLETYLLARVKEAEQNRQGAATLMQEFFAMVADILNDPNWQQTPWPAQAAAYGSPNVGMLAYGRVVVP